MKKKILRIFLLLIIMLGIASCTTKEEREKKEMKEEIKQDIIVIEKNEDGTVKKGTLEGYNFAETTEKTERVKIEMSNGSIMLVVLSNKDTPITIANFKKLVSEHFYDGLIFHRVIEDFMIQTGDPTGTGYHGSDETIKGEFSANGVKNDLKHTRGVISMARSNDMNSASSQFFIVHKDYPSLNGQYASFGRVFAGLDVVDNIATVETDSSDKPLNNQTIKTIRFITIEEA